MDNIQIVIVNTDQVFKLFKVKQLKQHKWTSSV
jgi:hypothetical protein